MALASENLKSCGVKISTFVSGVPSWGSGIVYETPNNCSYNYVLTAKHIFQEDSITEFNKKKLGDIKIFYYGEKGFKILQILKEKEINDCLIDFEEDFTILIIKKHVNVNFQQILVSDNLDDCDQEFISWAAFAANESELHLFDFKRNDPSLKRVKLNNPPSHEALKGISGSGIFIKNTHILYGIVCSYPNDALENDTVDCTRISFSDINTKLTSLNKRILDTHSIGYKREINNMVIDIHQATINNVCLDLELARKRLKTDIVDDWFYDPLKYIDLLNQNYLFEQFSSYFNNSTYKANEAEQFYVPKKRFTLRQAMVFPFIDRIMYMAVVGVLAPKLDNAMIPSVYSARFNKFSDNQLILKGVEQWKKMSYKLSKEAIKTIDGVYEYNCVIEIDLLNFYDNINKDLLIDKVIRVCETENEKKACILLKEMLHRFSNKNLGLPQNSDASSLLASFYLNQVDLFMHSYTFAYYRFMDDIRIFCSDKYEARKILQMFEYELRRCDLSVNSQKTEIKILSEDENTKEGEISRKSFIKYDLKVNQISKLRKSTNYTYMNEAFHSSISLLEENIQEDINAEEDGSKRLNFALNSLELLGRKNINLLYQNSFFIRTMLMACKSLYDKPWLTTQICKVLNLMDYNDIDNDFWIIMEQIVLDKQYNTYAFQTYQIWLLMARHKYKSIGLIKYAVRNIEKNDETNKCVIASMIIYICSVKNDYKRIMLRKFNQNFSRGYFQNRLSLISLRSFNTDLITQDKIHPSLKSAPIFTHRFKEKDLVYILGMEDEDENENDTIEQLYSL